MTTKKIVSIILSIIMMLSMFSIGTYATENTISDTEVSEIYSQNIDILDYTLSDIRTMSSEEFAVLINAFEREYDPFNTYGTDRQLTCISKNSTSALNNGIDLCWTSGKKDHSTTGSHELITAKACSILMEDKGFWSSNHNAAIIISLTISLASILPDTDGVLDNNFFAGHFYNPKTNTNYLGDDADTAKTNTYRQYENAVIEYTYNGLSEKFCEYVGRMVHYIQDANEPHHAANITGANISHPQFEKFANDNIDSYLDNVGQILNSKYSYAVNTGVYIIVNDYATIANSHSGLVNNALNRTHWDSVAGDMVGNAAISTALLIYKLSFDAGIFLYFS